MIFEMRLHFLLSNISGKASLSTQFFLSISFFGLGSFHLARNKECGEEAKEKEEGREDVTSTTVTKQGAEDKPSNALSSRPAGMFGIVCPLKRPRHLTKNGEY